jgi:hypothetical protein
MTSITRTIQAGGGKPSRQERAPNPYMRPFNAQPLVDGVAGVALGRLAPGSAQAPDREQLIRSHSSRCLSPRTQIPLTVCRPNEWVPPQARPRCTPARGWGFWYGVSDCAIVREPSSGPVCLGPDGACWGTPAFIVMLLSFLPFLLSLGTDRRFSRPFALATSGRKPASLSESIRPWVRKPPSVNPLTQYSWFPLTVLRTAGCKPSSPPAVCAPRAGGSSLRIRTIGLHWVRAPLGCRARS